jgi:hypothetical protein
VQEEHRLYKSWTNKNYYFQSYDEIWESVFAKDNYTETLSTGYEIFNFGDYSDDGLDYWVIEDKLYFVIPASIKSFNYGSWDRNEYKYCLVSELEFKKAFRKFLKMKIFRVNLAKYNCGVGYIDWKVTTRTLERTMKFDNDEIETTVYMPVLKFSGDIQMEHG